MRKTTPLAALALLALLLIACKPEPAGLVFEIDNRPSADHPAICSVALRAKLTLPYGEAPTELTAEPGREDSMILSVPHHHEGDPVTLEAWCDTDEGAGYARIDGTLPHFYPATFIRTYPPRDWQTCHAPTASQEPAPCITGYFTKQEAAVAASP